MPVLLPGIFCDKYEGMEGRKEFHEESRFNWSKRPVESAFCIWRPRMNNLTNHRYVMEKKHNQTPEEIEFKHLVTRLLVEEFPGLRPCFCNQVAIRHPKGFYILDFYIGRLRLAFEIDGEYHWSNTQLDNDLKRDHFLRNEKSIITIHFPNSSLKTDDGKKQIRSEVRMHIWKRVKRLKYLSRIKRDRHYLKLHERAV